MNEDDARLRHLRGKKRLAAAALIAAAALWLGVQIAPPAAWTGYLRAAAEAAMVGGLADWFAVSALFRRPLGLPLPHTNLIVAHQPAIARGIARYIEREFLRSEALLAQVQAADFAAGLARFLDRAENRDRIFAEFRRAARRVLAGAEVDREILAAVADAVRREMKSADLRPGAREVLRGLADSALPAAAVKRCAALLGEWLESDPDLIRRKVREGSHWYLPKAFDARLAAALARGLREFARALGDDSSPEFAQMRQALRDGLLRLETDDRALLRLFAALRKWSADTPEFPRLVATVVRRLATIATRDLDAGDSRLRAIFELLMRRLSDALATPRVRQRVNAGVADFFVARLGVWSDRIVAFVETTLMNQDARRFGDRIEAQVGADLQYIRLNGTVIGAAIGAALHAISVHLPALLAVLGVSA